MISRGLVGDLSSQIAGTHLYILYLVEKPCRFFSTKSMYSEEWWNGPLSDRSQSRGPPGLLLGRLLGAAAAAVTVERKHTQQWRLRLMRPHRAIRDQGEGGRWRWWAWFSSKGHSSLAGSSTGMTEAPSSPQCPQDTCRQMQTCISRSAAGAQRHVSGRQEPSSFTQVFRWQGIHF